jgi:phage terminase small subunit
MDFKDLKDSHKAFAKEYIVEWNGTKAYQKIYPESSYEAAMSSSCDLLRKPKIKAYIEHIQKDLLKLCGVSVLGNVNKLKEILESEQTDKASDKIKALEVINKMLGLNAPDKSELKHEGHISDKPSKITFSKKG